MNKLSVVFIALVALLGSAVQGSAPPAPVQITPTATSKVVSVGSDRYRVCNYDDLATRNYTVVIPEGLKTVRGLLVNACYAGGDSRNEWTICEYYRQFMHLHGFAYVGCTGTAGSPRSAPPAEDTAKARHRGIFQAFQDCMQVIATASQHPELGNAPYVGVGFSAGGGFALNVMAFAPEKTIAAVSYSSPYNFKRRITPPPSEALLSVPSICITGEQEGFNVPAPNTDPSIGKATIDEVFVPYRPRGAEYAWLERQGLGHAYDENRQDALGMPLLDAAVRARYPKDGDVTKGPIKLLAIDPSTGWIADNATWKSGLTKIYPAKEFKGDLRHSSWLLNEDLAFIYRAYSTYDKPLVITSPGNCWPTVPPLDSGASAPIVVDARKFPNWKSMAFYDGAKKLGEITRGPTQFAATRLTPGYHVFSVLATDGDGNVRTADPKMVVVRPLPVAGGGLRLAVDDPKAAAAGKKAQIHEGWPFNADEAVRRQEETAKANRIPKVQDVDLGRGVRITLILMGNVWEWCRDRGRGAGTHPVRGATFGSRLPMFKTTTSWMAGAGANDRFGFRVAMDVE